MDITRRFGRRNVGSNPTGGTIRLPIYYTNGALMAFGQKSGI